MGSTRYLFTIVETLDTQWATDDHTTCRACLPGPDDTSQPTYTIRLLRHCSGECGCVVQIDHLAAVHDRTGTGDWAGTYDTPEQIGDPALRRYAEALLIDRVEPKAALSDSVRS